MPSKIRSIYNFVLNPRLRHLFKRYDYTMPEILYIFKSNNIFEKIKAYTTLLLPLLQSKYSIDDIYFLFCDDYIALNLLKDNPQIYQILVEEGRGKILAIRKFLNESLFERVKENPELFKLILKECNEKSLITFANLRNNWFNKKSTKDDIFNRLKNNKHIIELCLQYKYDTIYIKEMFHDRIAINEMSKRENQEFLEFLLQYNLGYKLQKDSLLQENIKSKLEQYNLSDKIRYQLQTELQPGKIYRFTSLISYFFSDRSRVSYTGYPMNIRVSLPRLRNIENRKFLEFLLEKEHDVLHINYLFSLSEIPFSKIKNSTSFKLVELLREHYKLSFSEELFSANEITLYRMNDESYQEILGLLLEREYSTSQINYLFGQDEIIFNQIQKYQKFFKLPLFIEASYSLKFFVSCLRRNKTEQYIEDALKILSKDIIMDAVSTALGLCEKNATAHTFQNKVAKLRKQNNAIFLKTVRSSCIKDLITDNIEKEMSAHKAQITEMNGSAPSSGLDKARAEENDYSLNF